MLCFRRGKKWNKDWKGWQPEKDAKADLPPAPPPVPGEWPHAFPKPKPPPPNSTGASSSSMTSGSGGGGGGGDHYEAAASGGWYVKGGHGWIDPQGRYHP